MGRPYHKEIEALHDTFCWAAGAEVAELGRAMQSLAEGSLIVVGSGGSLSVARFVAALHESATGHLARACTPLDFESLPPLSPATGVLVLTAGGSNPDVISAMKLAREKEPHRIVALAMRKGSRLARSLPKDDRINFFEYPVPFGKDGYLATNSLLGAATILSRAVIGEGVLAETLPELLGVSKFSDYCDTIERSVRACFQRRFIIVLHDRNGMPGAHDIETRCSEVALAAVQVSDLRNFAHGRHQWIARHGDDTAVICLHSESSASLARRTLSLLPDNVPQAEIVLPAEAHTAGLVSFVASIVVAKVGGDCLGVDPGRPEVPDFGRKLYRLRSRPATDEQAVDKAHIQRRLRRHGLPLSDEMMAIATVAEHEFRERMARASFGSVVLDFDGTLLGASEKKTGLRKQIGQELNRLLDLGIRIGIATGRGHSVRKDLRRAVASKHWAGVLVGYYNGSQLGTLQDEQIPCRDDCLDGQLQEVYERLRENALVRNHCIWTQRGAQLTVETSAPHILTALKKLGSSTASAFPGVRAVWSSHSVDLLSPGVSKLSVVDALASNLPSGLNALCIGDKGAFPGNDFELLQTPWSLSVDEEPAFLDRGWRISPKGCRGVDASLRYLAALQQSERRDAVKLVWEELI